MPTQQLEKGKEQRLSIEPGDRLKLQSKGNFLRATAVGVDASGLLVECAGLIRLAQGDPVSCDIDYGETGEFETTAPRAGTVIHIDAPYIAIRLGGDLTPKFRP